MRPVQVDLRALDIAASRDGDDDVLLGDEVLHGHVALGRDDAGASLVAELLHDVGELVADDLPLAALGGEDRFEVGDPLLDLGELVDDPLALEGGEAAQLEQEDRAGLLGIDVEQGHEAVAGLVRRRRAPDERDDLVERVERLDVAPVDVGLPLGLGEQVPGAPDDDLDLVVDPVPDELDQPGTLVRVSHRLFGRQYLASQAGGRSMAFHRDVWRAVGGFPEIQYAGEDQPTHKDTLTLRGSLTRGSFSGRLGRTGERFTGSFSCHA